MESGFSLIELFTLGGPFMWVLLAFSAASLAVIIERCIYLYWHNTKVFPLRDKIISYIREEKTETAVQILSGCSKKESAAAVFLALLKNAPYGQERMERAAETEAREKLRRMESGFNYLTALSSLAPLTGFLGTVSGMIGAFKSIAQATDVNAQLVAGGIYEALITTVFGLIIAIVSLTAWNLLIVKVDTFASETSKAVNDITGELAALTSVKNNSGIKNDKEIYTA